MSTPCVVRAAENPTIELYIHYDGDDIEMVKSIVNIAKKHHARNINYDESYGMARLCCAAAEYLDNEETGFGVNPVGKNSVNYVYLINRDWSVDLDKEAN